MSDAGKRWWRITGLPDTGHPVYVYDRTGIEAREAAGRAYLEARRASEEEVEAYFTSLAEPAPAKPAPKGPADVAVGESYPCGHCGVTHVRRS